MYLYCVLITTYIINFNPQHTNACVYVAVMYFLVNTHLQLNYFVLTVGIGKCINFYYHISVADQRSDEIYDK